MIRTAWFFLVAGLATLVAGAIVFVASILRLHGGIYDRVARAWSHVLIWAGGVRIRVHDLDRVDWSTPKVVVCNHTGAYEILALATTIPRRSHFVAKKELERVPVFGPAWKLAGHISIDRDDRQSAIESLRQAAELINRDGGVVVIFPEGTRSRDGRLQPFKKGAFMLAIEAGVPILPTVATGSGRITPPGRVRVNGGTLDLYYGEEVDTGGYTTGTVDQLMEVVHARMKSMLEEHGLPQEDAADPCCLR